jgi:hypothetical protein
LCALRQPLILGSITGGVVLGRHLGLGIVSDEPRDGLDVAVALALSSTTSGSSTSWRSRRSPAG